MTECALVYGLGVTGRAVAFALERRGLGAVLVDDNPTFEARGAAEDLGLRLYEAPSEVQLKELLTTVDSVIPSPGIPENHLLFDLANSAGLPVVGEFDLAAAWDGRPCVAVTGTDGKTTVTSLVTRMLRESGVRAYEAGNTEVPLVQAIGDAEVEVFVVEASSFRLAPLKHFRPTVAAWLNFSPDHLDVHRDLASYEAAKANIWAEFEADQLAVANAADAVVMRHAQPLPNVTTFSAEPSIHADWRIEDGNLCGPDGLTILGIGELPRSYPHDLANALAAAAIALAAGAEIESVRHVLRTFKGLPHRLMLVGEAGEVRWYDDSKATTPHAAVAAVAGFDSVVLIAGGRNKGTDLSELTLAAPKLRAVVAIGEAADQVAQVFKDVVPVSRADSMAQAVAQARSVATPGDVVLLSPGCASFDWYRSYAERGDDFARVVDEALEATR